MYVGYKHSPKEQVETNTPLLLQISNETIACVDIDLVIEEDITDVVEAGFIGYKTQGNTPDVNTADDSVVFTSYTQGTNTYNGEDLSLLSYDSITETGTKRFYGYGYIKFSDGTYKFSDEKTGVFSPNTLSNGLEAYYDFENNANDKTGNGNNATPVDISYDQGVISKGARLNGSTSEIRTPLSTSGLSEVSTSIWVKLDRPNSNGIYQAIISSTHGGTNNAQSDRGIAIYTGSAQIRQENGYGNSSTTRDLLYNNLLSVGEWNHVTISYSPAQGMNVFVNGELNASDQYIGDLASNGLKLRIGEHEQHDNNEHHLQGMVDGFYFNNNRGISQCEVKLLYRKGQGLPYGTPPSVSMGSSTATNITYNGATLETTDTFSDGSSPISSQGFVVYPSGSDENDSSAVSFMGVSPLVINGLSLDTDYCFKPYASSETGTTYGSEGCFSTTSGNGTPYPGVAYNMTSPITIDRPTDLIVDQSGNIFVASFGDNDIFKIDPSGNITTFISNSGVQDVRAMTMDSSGYMYYSVNPLIRKVDLSSGSQVSSVNTGTGKIQKIKISPSGSVVSIPLRDDDRIMHSWKTDGSLVTRNIPGTRYVYVTFSIGSNGLIYAVAIDEENPGFCQMEILDDNLNLISAQSIVPPDDRIHWEFHSCIVGNKMFYCRHGVSQNLFSYDITSGTSQEITSYNTISEMEERDGYLYLSHSTSGSYVVSKIDISTMQSVTDYTNLSSIPDGAGPVENSMWVDGAGKAYATNGNDDTVFMAQ